MLDICYIFIDLIFTFLKVDVVYIVKIIVCDIKKHNKFFIVNWQK